MKKTFRTFLTLALLIVGTGMAWADDGILATWDFTNSESACSKAAGGQGQSYEYASDVDGIIMKVDATNGKFNPRGNDVQVNSTTIIRIPVKAKGDEVTIWNYRNGANGVTYTIGDETKTVTDIQYTYTANKVDAQTGYVEITVIGSGYMDKFSVCQHEPQQETVKKEKLIYSTEFSDWASAGASDSYSTDVTTTDQQKITFTLHQTKVDPNSFDTSRFKEPSTKGYLIAEKSKQGTITTTAINNITKLTFIHGATGGSRGWGLKVKGDGDADWVTLSSAYANPSAGTKVDVDVNRTNVQLMFYNLTDAQNAYLMSLEINGMVEVTGESYKVSVAASPAEGGSASIYPKADDFTEGDDITLTAEENFGYDFVNWTNAAGEEVSKEAKYKTTVTADETYTANFVKVNTYALDVTVDGGNDYMVTLNPAPTVVEGKNMYEAGTKVTLTASSNPIVTFTNWSDGQTEKEIVYTMDADKSVTANFSAIDYIVGWDFMQPGNNSRKADFAAADNDAVTLDMRNEDGTIVGWLDKSQFGAGGYEGRPGGVCWVSGNEKGDVGHCYWQTKVNAEAFTNIKVITSMVYNYNAYQTYNIEVSTDGTSWEKAGNITMTGAKNWADATIELTTKYSNQKDLYIRWIADKSSKVDGSSDVKDGACIGASYIIGTAKLVDDGTAPKLVSSVPAEGADNASANGKIVLTFDEKVKVAENAVASLNGKQLTPAVSGKTVTFEYKDLEYSSSYTFTLPANSVADLTDNFINQVITINFKTKSKPAIDKGEYDVIIMLDDENNNEYTPEQLGKQLADAIAMANKRADQTKRFRILVPPATIKIPAYDTDVTVTVELKGGEKVQKTYKEPRTYITGNNISIIGLDYEKTIITNSTPTETFNGAYGEANISEGIGNNDVFQITGTGTYFQGVTIKTGIGDARGRDLAIHDKGNKTIFKDTRLWGYQDTYTNNNSNGRTYFEGGVVRGRTDYLCGKADIWFEGVTLQQCGQGGYPIVPSTPKKYGWIFNHCTLKPETSNVTCTLGRPWGSGTPIALLINTTMEVVPGAEGWSEMSGGWPKRFAEYNSMTKTGTAIDLSSRKRTFGGKENCNNPILTAAEASEYSIAKVMGDGDDWDPTAATEQASAPSNAVCDANGIVTWDNSNYVLGWIVYFDDEPVTFVKENKFDVKSFINGDETAKAKAISSKNAKSHDYGDIDFKIYVAGVNEMGGIGERTEVVANDPTGIKNTTSVNANSPRYNVAGQKVSSNYKGIVISNGNKVAKK